MNFKEFLMKWRFRLDQSRMLFGLVTFAALLAADYIIYIPFLDNLGLWGVVILTMIGFLIFAAGGYVYDRGFKLWRPNLNVNIDRNPYNFAPTPKEANVSSGLESVKFLILLKIAKESNIDLSEEFAALLKIYDYYDMDPNSNDFKAISQEFAKTSKLLVAKLREELVEYFTND